MNHFNTELQKAQVLAQQVLQLKRNSFLDNISELTLTKNAYIPYLSWVKLSGFRMGSSYKSTKETMEAALGQWLRSSHECGIPCALFISKKATGVSLYYGSTNTTAAILRTHLPECEISLEAPSRNGYQYCGVFLGTLMANSLSETIASSSLKDVYFSAIHLPVADSELQNLLANDQWLEAQLKPHSSFQRISGTSTRRTTEIPIQKVVNALEVLKEEQKFLLKAGSVFRTLIRFGANTRAEYEQLAQLIQGCLRPSETQQVLEPIRCFKLQGDFSSLEACLAIPSIELDMSNNSLRRAYALSLQNISACTSLSVAPLNSYPGFYVTTTKITEESRELFPVLRPTEPRGIVIGKTIKTNNKIALPLQQLLCHLAVFGAPNMGKTTLIKQVLQRGWSLKKIPFVVLEAAKKEYNSLVQNIPELRILTPGLDGNLLKINPLRPEDGVAIEKHVAAVVRALISTTGAEHPLPEAFTGLLKQAYASKGWYFGALAYTDSHKPFPTFKDVLEQIDSYVEKHAQYGPEVKQNITAALKLRCELFSSGALGRAFSDPFGLTAKELLASPTIIELADYDAETTSFIMNILLFRMQSYLEHLPSSSELQRLIVVEEAHNIFRKTTSETSALANSNLAFEKMFAEVRASGTGIIISDQRPSIIPDAVLANTAIKISLALGSGQDRKAIGTALGLSELQTHQLISFTTGEAIASLRGTSGVYHIQVDKPEESPTTMNAACLVCACKIRCKQAALQGLLAGMDPRLVQYHLAKLAANPYNPEVVSQNIEELLKDLGIVASKSTLLCLLGLLLQKGSFSGNDSRIIINCFKNAKGENL